MSTTTSMETANDHIIDCDITCGREVLKIRQLTDTRSGKWVLYDIGIPDSSLAESMGMGDMKLTSQSRIDESQPKLQIQQ